MGKLAKRKVAWPNPCLLHLQMFPLSIKVRFVMFRRLPRGIANRAILGEPYVEPQNLGHEFAPHRDRM